MAIATYDDLLTRQLSPRERITQSWRANSTVAAGRLQSLWTFAPFAGVAPTTAAVPARNIAGAVGQENGGANALRLPAIDVASAWGAGPNILMLCDRLSHQGGLSGTVTSAQTTNLPTAALTRYTSGVGVMCMLEIYTTIGATATTVATSYTDQGGTTGQVSPLTLFGGNGWRDAGRGILIPCAVGDTGFRAVASVTVTVSTGTAGNFGVTLFKPLLYLPIPVGQAYLASPPLGTLGGGLPEILDDACLFWIVMPTGALLNADINLTHRFAED